MPCWNCYINISVGIVELEKNTLSTRNLLYICVSIDLVCVGTLKSAYTDKITITTDSTLTNGAWRHNMLDTQLRGWQRPSLEIHEACIRFPD